VGLRCAVLLALLALACATPFGASAATDPTILVKFTQPARAPAKVAALGDQLVRDVVGQVSVVRPASGETTAEALADYRSRDDVVYAEPNLRLQLLDINPDDTYYASQWALTTIGAPAGWSMFPGTFAPAPFGAIGIVDSGVDATNPDLQGRISASSATCLGTTCTVGIPTDNDGHGTHVSGIAGAATDNGVGIAGLAYASPLIVVRVFDNSGSGAATSDVANGIAWAASHGAAAINLSLGGYSPAGMPITLCNAIELAINSYHSVVVAAAGNDAVASPSYPAACPGTIGVAATDQSDAPAYFSNYGSPNVFVSAPGVNVLSTYPGAFDCSPDPVGYCTESGTSMASPLVTALAALIRTEHPEATVGQVRQMLAENSDKLGPSPYVAAPVGTCSGCTWEQHYGYGRINVQRALTAAVPALPPPPPPPPASPPPPPTSALTSDKSAPAVHVYAARARHGTIVRLRYRVHDDKGETAEKISVYRRTRVLRQLSRPLRPTGNAVVYWISWRAPRLRGSYRFCVRATDSAGNRSPLACASVSVR
jgi:subtilisin family serine protease